jgi:crotonobetainyl-CoA:carnitine CoA-transferase CaiB-like acyl-CoA transferase
VGCRDCPGFTALDRYHACADGWITLAVSETRQFAALAAALGRPDWPARWSPDEAMAEARDGRLAQEIAAEFAGRSREAVLDALAAAGVPCAPVLTQREAGACEALWRNGYYQIFAHPRWGELVGSRGYARFGEAPAQFDRLEPDLGEHSVEVLLDHGFDRDRIIALARAGVIFRG